MPTYIALLRGINVGGQKVIRMADLRSHFARCGATKVRTYIQSGNVIERKPGLATQRNWNTVTALCDLAARDS